MISNIFFNGKVNSKENKIIYEEDFVLFYLKFRLQNNSFNIWEAIIILEELYGKEYIKNKQFMLFCEKYFNYKTNGLYINLSEKEKNLYRKITEYSKEIMSIDNIQLNEIKEHIKEEIIDNNIPFEIKLKKIMMYYQLETESTYESKVILLYKFFYILKNYYKIYRSIDLKLEKILNIFDGLEITELNFSNEQLNFLFSNNVFTIKNLKYMSIDILICIFCEDIDNFIKEINQYTYTKQEIIDNLIQRFKNILNADQYMIIEKRFSFNINDKYTLEDIGNELNISRERVRQIERRAILNILREAEDIKKILKCFYNDIKNENNNFITFEELYKYIGNEQLVRYFLIISSYQAWEIIFNVEYGILYNKNEITFEEILKQAQRKLGEIIPILNTEKYNKIQKKILETQYKIYQDKVFIKKGINTSEIYLKEIRENFVNGYDIGSEEDHNELKQIINKKYGLLEVPAIHSIQALIDRSDLVQVDRGKYKAKEYVADLSEDLITEIISYIIDNSPLVPYNSIFEHFKEDLEKLSINNKYYLKGLLDRNLPEKFNTNRDFITTSSKDNVRVYDVLVNIFKSFEHDFTIEDVREKMPGLEMYSYENYAKIEEKNGLLNIGEKTYIYIDKLNISTETQKELKEYIDNLFEKMDSKTLTAKKIYANLSIRNKELLDKLNITAKFGDFELFSIIKYLFKNDYYYSRPLICLEKDDTISTYSLIKEYVKKLDEFSYTDVKNYIYKMNLGILYSYMIFMEDLSDEYVQINRDSMIRIEKLEITQEDWQKIEDFIDLLLRSKEFRTDDFNGYFMLPKLKKPWNKYMLIGIIRTYFKDKYEIENTTNFYDTTEFIVRRKK